MTNIADMVLCPKSIGKHDFEPKEIRRNLTMVACKNCQMEWDDIVREAEKMLPLQEGLYQGVTYLWEFDGETWNPLRAPSGMSGPVFDMPLRKVRLVAA